MTNESHADHMVSNVTSAWSNNSIPEGHEFFEDCSDCNFIYSEQQIIYDWLIGKSYLEMDYGGYMETECPLLYLSPLASSYYIAGYLIKFLIDIKNITFGESSCPSFATIHFIGYVASEKIIKDVRDLRNKQIVLIYDSLNLSIDDAISGSLFSGSQELFDVENTIKKIKSVNEGISGA